jgi:hypothetical protein
MKSRASLTAGNSATVFEKRIFSFSPRALNEHKLGSLAGEVVEATPGAIVGCGTLPLHRASYLANLGLAQRRDVYLAETTTATADALRDRGYCFHDLDLDFEQPGKAAPQAISLLYIRERDLARVVQLLSRLQPRLAAGGATVVEGLGEDSRGLLEHLAALGLAATQEEPGAGRFSFLWWINSPAGDAAEEPIAQSPPAERPGGDEFVVLATPDLPRGKFATMCAMAGYRTTNDIAEGFDVAIKWFGETYTPAGEILQELSAAFHVINGRCEDISKSHVEAIHRELFGYGLMVDPTTYAGLAVVKANLNAQCRESVVACPLAEARTGLVYQRLVVTRPEPEEFEEYRVPITGTAIPCVVVKRRPLAQRFDRSAGYAQLTSAAAVFEASEIGLLLEFCRRIGLEFGDLDVLRDRGDGRIYVIDANPTPGGPGGPGGGYTAEQRRELLEIQLEALERYFLEVLAKNGRPAAESRR